MSMKNGSAKKAFEAADFDAAGMMESMTKGLKSMFGQIDEKIEKIKSDAPIKSKPVNAYGVNCMLQLMESKVVLMVPSKDVAEKYFEGFGQSTDREVELKKINCVLEQRIAQLHKENKNILSQSDSQAKRIVELERIVYGLEHELKYERLPWYKKLWQ